MMYYMSAILHDSLDTNPLLPCTLYILYFVIVYWDQVYNDSDGYWSDLVVKSEFIMVVMDFDLIL